MAPFGAEFEACAVEANTEHRRGCGGPAVAVAVTVTICGCVVLNVDWVAGGPLTT